MKEYQGDGERGMPGAAQIPERQTRLKLLNGRGRRGRFEIMTENENSRSTSKAGERGVRDTRRSPMLGDDDGDDDYRPVK